MKDFSFQTGVILNDRIAQLLRRNPQLNSTGSRWHLMQILRLSEGAKMLNEKILFRKFTHGKGGG